MTAIGNRGKAFTISDAADGRVVAAQPEARASGLPRQAKAVSIRAAEKRRQIDKIRARRSERLRALEQDDPRFQSLRDFKRALPGLPDLDRLAE
jgi:hypothetical protein